MLTSHPCLPTLVCFARATRTATLSLRLWTQLDTKTALSRCLQNNNIAIISTGRVVGVAVTAPLGMCLNWRCSRVMCLLSRLCARCLTTFFAACRVLPTHPVRPPTHSFRARLAATMAMTSASFYRTVTRGFITRKHSPTARSALMRPRRL